MENILNMNSISNDAVKQESSHASGEHVDEYCTAKTSKEGEVLESAKAQMTHVREENAKLKMLLQQIENDYKSLQMRFFDVVQQESNKTNNNNNNNNNNALIAINEDIEEHDFVSLRLGRSPSTEPKKEDNTTSSSSKMTKEDHEQHSMDGLKLSLDYTNSNHELKNDSSSHGNSLIETKEDEIAGETWPPSKVLKTTRSGDDELSQPAIKRARVSVRARCDSPTLNDGCQWRKYGQKISKGNPCPRAYYRCTVAPSCPVRKQVQRCSDDMSILITTYEGTHNHPLPMSATAMASTTSAAASMLLSGSSTSSQSGFNSSPTPPTINLSGLNVNLSENSKTRPFYFPNSSVPQFPTITLDLTANPSTSSAHFNMFSSSFQQSPRYPSTSLNFSSPESSMLPSVWSNGYLNYKTGHGIDSSPLSKQFQELYYQPYMEKNNQAVASQQALAETLTKAITSDPSIQSVIAAAISSMVAGGSSQGLDRRGEISGVQSLKWAENVQVLNSNPLSSNGKGCAPSFLNRTTSLDSQNGSLRLQQQPPLAFSISNSSSRSTVDNGDQTN